MLQSRRRFAGLALAVAGLAAAGAGRAQPAPQSGEPVLVISGKVAAPQGVQLDMAALERLPQHSFTTSTPWTRAPQTFTGPLLRDVLRQAGAHGASLHATALNDYKVAIPAEDAQREDVIVALRIDGKPIPVRERGPLFVIYPFDSKPQLQSQRYYERSIWQLKAIRVE
jgi:hypothetical protein